MTENLSGPAAPGFTGLLLAGGHSRRMGRDKTQLPMPDGRPLWLHQAEKLAAAGAAEVIIACRPDQSFQVPDQFPVPVGIVHDTIPDSGPLGGIAAGLVAAQTPLVFVLAVDLPHTTAAHIRAMIDSGEDTGLVIERDGLFEPLFAVWPVAAHTAISEALAQNRLALQPLVRDLIAAGLMKAILCSDSLAAALRNVNTPSELLCAKEPGRAGLVTPR